MALFVLHCNIAVIVLMAPRKESIMYYDIVESGKRIKEMRKKAGMTQEELADAIGMTREALARIETGKNGTSVDGIINFAHYFKTSTDNILGWTDEKFFDNDIKRKPNLVAEDKKKLAYKCILGLLDNFIC